MLDISSKADTVIVMTNKTSQKLLAEIEAASNCPASEWKWDSLHFIAPAGAREVLGYTPSDVGPFKADRMRMRELDVNSPAFAEAKAEFIRTVVLPAFVAERTAKVQVIESNLDYDTPRWRDELLL